MKIFINSEKDLQKLIEWKDNNKDIVRSFKLISDKGSIVFLGLVEQSWEKIDKDTVKLSYSLKFGDNEIKGLTFNYNMVDWTVSDVKGNHEINYSLDSTIQDMITILASSMALLQSYGVDNKGKEIAVSIQFN